MNILLEREHYITIWKVSFLTILSCGYACFRGYYDLAFIVIGVFFTSINYWRKPDYSWRRYLDMFYVKIAMIYQIIRAYNAKNSTLFYSLLFVSVAFYPIGVYFYKNGHYWLSTYSHCMLHIMANISNVVLYSGVITPFVTQHIFYVFYTINGVCIIISITNFAHNLFLHDYDLLKTSK